MEKGLAHALVSGKGTQGIYNLYLNNIIGDFISSEILAISLLI